LRSLLANLTGGHDRPGRDRYAAVTAKQIGKFILNALRSIAIVFSSIFTASIALAACGSGIGSGGYQEAAVPVMTIGAVGTTGLNIALDSGSAGYTLYVGNPSQWGYLQPGGYVQYTVNAPVAGTYALAAYYTAGVNAGANVLVNGAQQNTLNMPATTSWSSFAMSTATSITLPAGNSVIQIAAQPAFQAFNLAGLTVTPIAPSSAPPAATPVATTTAAGGNPLTGDKFYVSQYSQSSSQINDSCAAYNPGANIAKIADVAQGVWFNGDPTVLSEVQGAMGLAAAQQGVPILVAYNIPIRDCGGYSNGGAASDAAYQSWITQFAQGIGSAKAVVILEPDAISQMSASGCLTSAQITDRESLLNFAVQTITSLAPNASVYIDAGQGDDTIPPATIATELTAAGVASAAGFSLNVANYVSTADNTNYGQQVSALIGGKHFVIDTSRNGLATANGVWCNPPNQGAGTPTVGLSSGSIDGYLWVQNPGTSDGACGGMSGAGQWDLQQACSLAANAIF
jgi:endoglucanase